MKYLTLREELDNDKYPIKLPILVDWDSREDEDRDYDKDPKRFYKPIRSRIVEREGALYIVEIPLYIRMTKEELERGSGIGGKFLSYCTEYFTNL